MAERTPGVNYQAPLATDDLEFQQTSNSEEIQKRTRLVMGKVDVYGEVAPGNFGIVDTVDPREISITSQGRPLNVTPSTDPLRVDIWPGTGVTECGNWVTLDNRIFLFELASTAIGAVNVIYIEYDLEDGEDRRINKFNVDVAVRQQRPDDNDSVIGVTTLATFLDTAFFSPTRKSDIVVLAIVTVNQLADLSPDLTIDLGGSNFPFNRLWYSPTDVKHSRMVGTAEPTDTNPHGTSLNDLAAANLTLYQQTTAHGIVLSKDVDVNKAPGIKVTETIQAASFQTDFGSVTSRAPFYGADAILETEAQWANLQHFPIVLGSVYQTGKPAIQIAADFVPDSNILVIPESEPIPEEGITVEYLYAQAGEAPVDPATNDLTFLQPTSDELIIADGIAVSEIPSPLISFDGSGPIPRDYRVFIDSTGSLISSPQILLPAVKLDALGEDIEQPITRGMRGNAPIEIGLTRAANVTGMNVDILIAGQDNNGNPQSETLNFAFGTYQDSSVPSDEEEQNQFSRSVSSYSLLESITVTDRTNDGNDSTIIVYADQEAAVTETFKEKCPLADVFWDGLSVSNVLDARPVSLDLHLPVTPIFNATGAEASGSVPWLFEDLRQPRYRDSFEGDEAATPAEATITVADNEDITDGDTIQLGYVGTPTEKLITARTPKQASGSLGALDFGIAVPIGSTQFNVQEPGGSVSVNIAPAENGVALENLANSLASELTGASVDGLLYSGNVTVAREIVLSATGVFDITTSVLGSLIQLNPATGQSGYTGGSLPGLSDGDSFTLGDGTTEVTFEFDTGGGLNNTENTGITGLSDADLAATVRASIIAAIDGSDLEITPTESGETVVLLLNNTPGSAGNVPIAESISTGSTLNPIGMSGGSAGGAILANGEFNVDKDEASVTADNIAATINDPSFDSGITASSDDIVVSLTRNEVGLLNTPLEGTYANSPDPITTTGFEEGTSRYLGTSPDAFAEGLRTRVPSAGTDLDGIRKKYRSQAIARPSSFVLPTSVVSVVVHNPGNVNQRSVRVRAALASDPGNWQPYEFMERTQDNPSFAVFEHTFVDPADEDQDADIQKIQLEMFGQFTDFAICDNTNVGVVGQGPTGATGSDGNDGADGAVGPAGPAGPIGATGPTSSAWFSAGPFNALAGQNFGFVHNLDTQNIVVKIYDGNNEEMTPATVDVVNDNQVTIVFAIDTVDARIVITGEVE